MPTASWDGLGLNPVDDGGTIGFWSPESPMPHAIWKGAISFGLVHVPVALYPASEEGGIDFDWLDKRTMDPVGYKRINKRTGKEMKSEDIVKGIKQASGDYVVLSEDEIKEAYPKSTQTIGPSRPRNR